MDIRKVKKLIELLEESNIGEIEIKEGEESVRISRYGAQPAAPVAYAAPPAPAPGAAPAPVEAPAPEAAAPAPAPALAPASTVPELLARFNLAELYATAFDDEGYDDLPYLLTLDRERLLAVATDCGMKKGHATKFADWTLKHPDGILPHR